MKTPEPKFIFKTPQSEKPSLIYMVVRFDYKRIVMSTGEKALPVHWLVDEQKLKVTRKTQEYEDINAVLDRYKGVCQDIFRQYKYEGKSFDKDEIKFELEKRLDKREGKKDDEMSFVDFIEIFIPKSNVSDWTKKGYNTAKIHLEDYQREISRTIRFKDITIKFYDELIEYFEAHGKSKNTIGKNIKNIKVFINKAMEQGLMPENKRLLKKMKVYEEQTEKIYLNENEIQLLIDLDLSENKRLEKVRDLFVIACYTGLRFADFVSIRKENLKEKNGRFFLSIRTQKTGSPVVIPLKKVVVEIFEKYDFKIPRPITNQRMNEYLKEIGEKAKINENVVVNITKGGIVETTVYPKYKLMCTHVGRRSFASNLYLSGEVPTYSIMKLTSHRTEKSFLKYIRISEEEHALKMMDAKFFQ